MKRACTRLLLTFLGALVALTTMPGVRALPKFQPPRALIDLDGRVIDCPDFLEPQVELIPYHTLVGYPLVGFTVKVSAENVKFHGRGMPACGFPDFVAPLPEFSWSATRPDGTVAQLFETTSLIPRLRVDQAGTYVVRLTVCPGGCEIEPPGSHLAIVHVNEQFLDIPIEARESAPLAPETMPAVPPSDGYTHTKPADRCGFQPGLLAKQWWAVEQIDTPDDYRQLDGLVVESRVSRMDDPLNHGWRGPIFQDTNYHVVPDPHYRDLLFEEFDPDNPQAIEVEWERGSIPERYRPTVGDRVSVFGHWVVECAHDLRPEIHPPVGIAVHRPRPIRIPNDAKFDVLGGQVAGTGIYVPGIITDMYFSKDGGDLVDCDTDTGLANAEPVPGPNGTLAPGCVPQPSLDRVFEFDVYLPRNPQVTMRQAGFDVPPVPLYIQRDKVTGDPEPAIEVRPDSEGIPAYLHVTLDLRGYTGQSYAYRIAAGWVLPSTDNWGLARYKLRLLRLDVSDDGDGWARGDGDWRLWLNTNNASSESLSTQEWVRILNRDVHGTENFGGRPWETGLPGEPGAPAADRSLGPDLLRYPEASSPFPAPRDYGILFHSTGYEADTETDDDAGTVLVTHVARETVSTRPNQCEESGSHLLGLTYSGCVRYNAVFETVAGPAPAPAAFGREMRSIADQYVLRCRPALCKGGVLDEIVAAPLEAPAVDPLDVPLAPASAAREFTDFAPYEPAELEATMLTGITAGDFYKDVAEARKTQPVELDRMLTRLHGLFVARIADRDLGREAILDAQVVRASLPPDLWARYFSDLPSPRPDRCGSRAVFTGTGTLQTGRERVQLSAIALHCDAVRRPNVLSVVWGKNRFDLDLVLHSTCTDAVTRGGIDTHIQEGGGLGRLNGVPGASIGWNLVDGGMGGADTASITIRSGNDTSVLLDVSGTLRQGFVRARGHSGVHGCGSPCARHAGVAASPTVRTPALAGDAVEPGRRPDSLRK
jgi:hypothetical protein